MGLGLAALAARARIVAAAVTAALVLALGAATHARNAVYADEIGFWQDVTAKTPRNSRAWGNLGYALALAGRTAEAEDALVRALAADPANTRAAVNLRLLREGRMGDEGQ
jgi:Flp pilus assembly protein TadD